MACDTIYGIHGIVPGTEQRIREIKGRSNIKPFLMLVAEASWVKRLSDQKMPDKLTSFWPGPLTVVMSKKGGGSVGLRVPGDPVLRGILGELNCPLFSTSVNKAGGEPLNSINEIKEQFSDKVELIIDSKIPVGSTPSTVIDITGNKPVILRQGSCIINVDEISLK